MKIINLTLNGLNTLILAITTNYKLDDIIDNCKANRTKIIKLQHIIESYMLKNETITPALLQGPINEYDKIYEDLLFSFPHHIKMKVISKYQDIKVKNHYLILLSFLATADTTDTTAESCRYS